jgi:hypothetical protein
VLSEISFVVKKGLKFHFHTQDRNTRIYNSAILKSTQIQKNSKEDNTEFILSHA